MSNPIGQIYELCSILRLERPVFNSASFGPSHQKVFSGQLAFLGKTFEASGSSKKSVETECASQLMARLPFVIVPESCVVNGPTGFYGRYESLGEIIETPLFGKSAEAKRYLLAKIVILKLEIKDQYLKLFDSVFAEVQTYRNATDGVDVAAIINGRIDQWAQNVFFVLKKFGLEATAELSDLIVLAFIRPKSFGVLGEEAKIAIKERLNSIWADNSVLAFMGDRVLGAAVASQCSNFLSVEEAQADFSRLTREDALVNRLRSFGFEHLGMGDVQMSNRDKCECCEAILGAFSLALGLDVACSIALRFYLC